METKRIVCYANINSFNSPEGVTDEHMCSFFEHYFKESSVTIVDVIVDRYENNKPLSKREGWKRVVAICEARCADCVVVPSTQMFEPAVSALVDLVKEFDFKYRIGFAFLLENIAEGGEQFLNLIQLQATIMSWQGFINKNADKMRRKFYEATGLNGEASAKPVYVDYALYDVVEKKAREYGDCVDDLVRYLLKFATDPANEDVVDRYVYGVEPTK